MLIFLLGILAGILPAWVIVQRYRLAAARSDEALARMEAEKELVLGFLHNMAEGIAAGVDREVLFHRMAHSAVLGTGALSACAFSVTPAGRLHPVAVEGLFPPQFPVSRVGKVDLSTRTLFIERVLRSRDLDMSETIFGEVARSWKPIWITDGEGDPRLLKQEDPALVVHTMIVAPMVFRDKLLGVLSVANTTDGLPYSETDYSLVLTLAEQAAVAIHNADQVAVQLKQQRLDMDLELARRVQGMLLPKDLSRHRGMDTSAAFLPAAQVGGDMFQVFPGEGNTVAVVIADVAGKGIAASLLMALCQAHLSHLSRDSTDPAEVLRRLNREMGPELGRQQYVTAVYAVIDFEEGVIRIARAGHEKPLLGQVGCDVEVVSGGGFAIGLVPPELFDDALTVETFRFEPGDVLVLYTDGVTESRNREGSEFSTARLRDLVQSTRKLSAEEINAAILAAVDRFREDEPLGDDLTVLTVKRMENGSRVGTAMVQAEALPEG